MTRIFDPRLLRQARPVRRLLILTVTLGALSGVLIVLAARVLAGVVNGVFLGGLALADVWPLLVALAVIAVARGLLLWAGDVTANRVATHVKTDLRERLTAHLLALGPAYIRGERTGELVNTAVEGIEALDAYFSQYLPQLALAVLVPVTFLLFVFPLDFLSGLVLLLTAPLIPLFMILIGNLADGVTRRQWTALSRMSAHFLDVLQGLTTLKLFNRSREQIAVIAEISARHRDATLDVLRIAFLSALVLEMVGTLSTAIIAVEVGLRLLYSRMAFEQAFFVLILAPEFYQPLRLLGTRFHAGITGVTAARRIFEVLETPAAEGETRRRGDTVRNFSVSPCPRVAVSFTDVHYAYDDGARPALNGVTFEIRPGEKVALVGPSGAGKSTVAALLLGFIAPTAGAITLASDSGQPQLPAEQPNLQPFDALRACPARSEGASPSTANLQLPTSNFQLAWVPQLPYLFNATIADNIRLGRPAARMDAVLHAAQLAEADAFIRELPLGYDTVVGERGARLSGGQAQRIALARAFLVDAPLVILDEATANLDAVNEAAVQAALERLLAGRTALIIAHRLNTVRAADRIIVLNDGRVAEIGSHDALMAQGGLYRELVEAGSGGTGEQGSRGAGERGNRENAEIQGQGGGATAEPGKAAHAQYETGNPHTAQRATFLRLLSLLAPFWPWIVLSVVLGFATIGSSIGLMATSAWIIATAALHPSIAVLQVAIVGVRFFGIARGLLRYCERLASHQVTFRVLARLRTGFYAALEPLAPARLMQHRSGDLLSRIMADVSVLENFYIRAVAPPLVALLIAALMWAFLGSFDRRLAVAVITLMALAGIAAPCLAQALSRQPGRRLNELRGSLNAALVDAIQGAADLAAFGGAGMQVGRVRALSDDLGGAQGRMAVLAGLNAALSSLLANLAVIVVVALAIPWVAAGQLAGVSLAVLALATAASFEAVQPLPLAAHYLEGSLAAARRLFRIVDGAEPQARGAGKTEKQGDTEARKNEATAGGGAVSSRHPGPTAPRRPAAVSFEAVSLRYAPGEPLALEDITFAVPAGARVAIVGPSGAGKSTVANALLRFWDYQAGEIRLDGDELRTIEPEAVRRQIGVVAQQTHLFNATVRDNLRLARAGAAQAELEAAARAAQIHDFIISLPQGYDTWIGEQGLRLSGGERQRLAIARALLKDAPILILDEPSANLDLVTERAMLKALEPLAAGRTTLIITHRLIGLEAADEILVLDRGRIVERGRQRALLARGGLYRRLWEHQQQL